MALFRGIQEYIALVANNITLIFDSGNIDTISGNILLYPPQGHPILYNYFIPVLSCSYLFVFLLTGLALRMSTHSYAILHLCHHWNADIRKYQAGFQNTDQPSQQLQDIYYVYYALI